MNLKSSIVTQLAFRIAIIVIAICLVVGTASYIFIQDSLKKGVMAEVSLKAESASGKIQNIFENAKIYTSQMAINPLLIDYLKTTHTRKDVFGNPLYPETIDLLRKVKESNKIHFLAWVANEKANFYLDSNNVVPDDTYDVKKRPWYAVAVGSKDVAFTTPYVEWGTGKTVISSIKALRNVDESVYGFVVVDFVLETIPDIMRSIKLTNKDSNYLISPDGSYIYNEDPQKIMAAKITDAEDLLKPYADQILMKRQGFVEAKIQGKSYYLSYHPATDTGWIMISLIDMEMVSVQASKMTGTLLFILIIGLSLVLVFVLSVLQKKLEPVTLLSEIAEDISKGDFDRRVPKEFLAMSDEMGVLAQSFEKITDAFLKENEELETKIHDKNIELATQYRHIIETEKMAALGNLVAGVAHEINTPLGVGLSAASYLNKINGENRKKLLEGKMTRDDLQQFMGEMDESLEMLSNNLNRAAELIKSFKQVAVDQSNDGRLMFNLKENIDMVILSLKHEYKHQRHVILNNCPSYLMLDSYPGVYSQIFSNFMMNSIHHGFKGIEEGTMSFESYTDHQWITIVYKDDGLGISQENLSRIFEPFFTTNRSKGNNGLGMHIVYNLVTQKLGGSITCHSDEGQGVIFTVKVPIVLPYKEMEPIIKA